MRIIDDILSQQTCQRNPQSQFNLKSPQKVWNIFKTLYFWNCWDIFYIELYFTVFTDLSAFKWYLICNHTWLQSWDIDLRRCHGQKNIVPNLCSKAQYTVVLQKKLWHWRYSRTLHTPLIWLNGHFCQCLLNFIE